MDEVIKLKSYQLDGYTKHYFDVALNEIDDLSKIEKICADLYDFILKHNIMIIYEKVFGSVSNKRALLKLRKNKLDSLGMKEAPLTFIECKSAKGGMFSNITVFGIFVQNPKDFMITYYQDDKLPETAGTVIKCADWTAFYLCNISASGRQNDDDKNYGSYLSCLNSIPRYLRNNGLKTTDIVRTWVYLKDIVTNYAAFNSARNDFYQQEGITSPENADYLPASTGIEGISSEDSLITVDLICYDKRKKLPHLKRVHNRLQNEADGSHYLFKPSFSRGMLLNFNDHCEFQISGTASIDEAGKTVYTDDSYNQIKKSIVVIKTMLEDNGLSYNDICQSTYFFKKQPDHQLLAEILGELNINMSATALTVTNVCRDDLLFEQDGIAIKVYMKD